MRLTRAAILGLVALTFAAAEVIRPTHFVPKQIAARALLVHSQGEPGGTRDSLDPNLLNDVPRIHPDAVGNARLSQRRDGSFAISGTIADPLDGSTGAAAFIESDGLRLSEPRIGYGAEPNPNAFQIIVHGTTLGPGAHRLHVALISADQRGFFVLPKVIMVRVGRSHAQKSS